MIKACTEDCDDISYEVMMEEDNWLNFEAEEDQGRDLIKACTEECDDISNEPMMEEDDWLLSLGSDDGIDLLQAMMEEED